MWESREFSAAPILADALQDAGCDREDVLNHLRDPAAVHCRGCWVLDLVLRGARWIPDRTRPRPVCNESGEAMMRCVPLRHHPGLYDVCVREVADCYAEWALYASAGQLDIRFPGWRDTFGSVVTATTANAETL
jgi:hypothetical protein